MNVFNDFVKYAIYLVENLLLALKIAKSFQNECEMWNK